MEKFKLIATIIATILLLMLAFGVSIHMYPIMGVAIVPGVIIAVACVGVRVKLVFDDIFTD